MTDALLIIAGLITGVSAAWSLFTWWNAVEMREDPWLEKAPWVKHHVSP